MVFAPTRLLTLSFTAKFLIAKVIGRVYFARLRTYEFRMRNITVHGESQMDLYTQEDIQREKRMALLQRTAVAAVFAAIILAIWSL